MKESMLNYFKSEKEFYEFCLLELDGKVRADMLKITRACYTVKKVGENWYNNIRSKITNERAINKLNEIYNDMN